MTDQRVTVTGRTVPEHSNQTARLNQPEILGGKRFPARELGCSLGHCLAHQEQQAEARARPALVLALADVVGYCAAEHSLAEQVPPGFAVGSAPDSGSVGADFADAGSDSADSVDVGQVLPSHPGSSQAFLRSVSAHLATAAVPPLVSVELKFSEQQGAAFLAPVASLLVE